MTTETSKLFLSKTIIIEDWVFNPVITTNLLSHHIEPAFFYNNFATHIFDYLLAVLEKTVEPGTCPVMEQMILTFKRRKIPLCDIFELCSGFKNTILKQIYLSGEFSEEFINNLTLTLDSNFKGIINEFVFITFHYSHTFEKSRLQRNAQHLNKNDKETTSGPHLNTNIITAQNYMKESCVSQSTIQEIRELCLDFQDYIDSIRFCGINEHYLFFIIRIFNSLAKSLHSEYEFEKIAFACEAFSNELLKVSKDDFIIDDDFEKTLLNFVQAVFQDITAWIDNIFIKQTAQDIHYLDDSFIASALQLSSIINPQDTKSGELVFFI